MAKQETTITKTEAVRQAFAKFGKDVGANEALSFIKDSYGHDLSKSHFFNIKSMLTKKAGKKKRGRPRKGATEATAAVASAPKVRSAISLDDLHTIKSLSSKYGVQSVKNLIDLVGK